MGKKDLKSEELARLDWKADAAASLDKVRVFVTTKARKAVDWYYVGKKSKKWAAWGFRVGMILLTAAAGIVPLLNEIHRSSQTDRQYEQAFMARTNVASLVGTANPTPVDQQLRPVIPRGLFNPVWSAVLLALAGLLLALDRFHGATSGWVRYVLTAQQLTQAMDDFELAFEAQKIGWADGKPSVEQTRAALELAQRFVRQANEIVQNETKAWAADFAEALKQLDEQLKAAGEAKRQSAIEVTVTNGDQCAGNWQLGVDQTLQEDRLGKEASVLVLPGPHVVRAAGKIGAKNVRAEKAVNAEPGKISQVNLTLA